MRTTTEVTQVGPSTELSTVAERLTAALLATRNGLPKARNGEHIAPSNQRAAQIRKEMKQQRSAEFLRLLTVIYTDLEDGVPFQIATAPVNRMLTFLKHHADAMRRHAPRAIGSAIHYETRTQHRLDMLQMRLLQTPSCAETLNDAIADATKHIAALEEFRSSCEAELTQRQASRDYALKALAR